MTTENGNGELRQLLEIKRNYRKDLEAREAELKAEYERELASARKETKQKYLEKIVDTVFAEPAPAPEPTPEPAPVDGVRLIAGYEPQTVHAADEPRRCPECDAPVDPMDKFCAECASPLQEDVKENAPVVSTGRKFRPRVRR
jgi:hypothetical protein